MAATALWLVAAMLALGALAFVLLFYLGTIRLPLVANGKVKIADMALSRDAWPERERQVSNAFDNQFQLPVLFYVACLLELYLGATLIVVLLAWAFVVSRYAHAWIFVTTNHVIHRFTAYTIGLAILSLMWLVLVVRWIVIALTGTP